MTRAGHRTRAVHAAVLTALALAGQQARAADVPAAGDSRLPSAQFREEVLSMAGDPARPVALQVTVFTPAGPGPFPLAVMNHGATGTSAANRGERTRFTIPAYYFLSRGYAVALPMMRGFAGSGGSLASAGCKLDGLAQANARDIRAVIEAMAARPDIDRTRVVVAGQSFGGWNTLGLGASPPAGVRGLVTFNAAVRTSDCPMKSQDSSMAAGAGRLGARTALPALMFYGENDSVISVPAWRAVFNLYARGNPRAELVNFGAYGDDAHQVLSFSDSLPLWTPKLDAFLAGIGLPSAPAYPQYLPHPAPPATQYAALADVAAVPLGEQGKALYRKFLAGPHPRAFVIGPGGAASQYSGGYDPLGLALRACGKPAQPCTPYAVNDAVVWTGPKLNAASPSVSRVVNRTVRMNASTSLGAFFAINPDCSSRGLPRVLVSTPDHGAAVAGPRDEHLTFPPGHAYAACNAAAVPAMGVTYTPAPGYTGADTLIIDQTDVDGRRQLIQVNLSVL